MSTQTTENPDYAAFLARAIAAHGRRVAEGDIDALPELEALAWHVSLALEVAVAGLRAEPNAYSWQQLADVLGVSRQAVMKRWPDAAGPRRPGGQPHRWR
jgi:hypothetical protein